MSSFYYLFIFSYPNATSNIIIVINPNIKPIVVNALFSIDASGNNSEPTTETIAPAEKAKKNGNMLLTPTAAIAPKNPAIGSTIPDACP